jgi:hypothetical protein
MVKLRLIKKEKNFEVDLIALKKIESAIKKLKGREFNLSTKRWAILGEAKDEFINSIKEYAEVEIIDDREDRTASLKFEREDNKLVISVSAFPRIAKSLEPLFGFFKTVPGRFYESIGKKWIFDIKNEEMILNGIKNVCECNKLIILII